MPLFLIYYYAKRSKVAGRNYLLYPTTQSGM